MKEETALKKFGQTIKSERQKIGFSQEKLAFECGLDRTYIGGIERGERNVSFLNIIKIATALKIHPSQLFAEILL